LPFLFVAFNILSLPVDSELVVSVLGDKQLAGRPTDRRLQRVRSYPVRDRCTSGTVGSLLCCAVKGNREANVQTSILIPLRGRVQ
jgi:hypothetical protein